MLPKIWQNAPCFSPPPPLCSRKRPHPSNRKKSLLPRPLQMEIVPLIHKYGISLDQSKPADTAGVTMLCQSSKCNLRWNCIEVIHLVRRCAYQEVWNVSFSENFSYVLNEWHHVEIGYYWEPNKRPSAACSFFSFLIFQPIFFWWFMGGTS